MRCRSSFVAGGAALALLLVACETEDPAAGDEVEIVDNAFQPRELEVAAGDTVEWTNGGQLAHTVTFEDGPDSGLLDSGETFTHTFDGSGTFAYRCTVHPGMTGTVEVAG